MSNIGRPKIYGSTSEKLQAFRQRQEACGYARKEVLMSQETFTEVKRLAQENSVSATDVSSALLELGLKAFGQHSPAAFQARSAGYDGQVAASAAADTHVMGVSSAVTSGEPLQNRSFTDPASGQSGQTNVIHQFFLSRKGPHHEK